jgi:hypothetical protein
MKRRSAIRNLILITGGAALLPSCLHTPGKASITLKNLVVDADQEKLLATVAGAIIPTTDTPGAQELGIHLFVLRMIDDCYTKEDRQTFVKGLGELEKFAVRHTGSSFSDADQQQRAGLLAGIGEEDAAGKALQYFTRTMRQLTIRGYLNSQYVMTALLPYQLVPGHFHGCVDAGRDHPSKA